MFALPAARRPLGVAVSLLLFISTAFLSAPATATDEQGYLGIMLQNLTPSMAKALQLGDRSGVIVNNVVDDGPAAKAGLLDGDVILEINGQSIADQAALTSAVRALTPGDEASVVLLRDGQKKTIGIEVGKLETRDLMVTAPDADQLKELQSLKWVDSGDRQVMVLPHGDGEDEGDGQRRIIVKMMEQDQDRGWLGVHLDALNGQLGEYFGVKDGAGVLVTEVVEGSPAAGAGLLAGDVIVKVGDAEVTSPDALHEAMSGSKAGDDLTLQVLRKGSRMAVTAKLGEMPEGALKERRLEIMGDGEPGELRMFAPRMMRHMGLAGDGDEDREIIIERKRMAAEDAAGVKEEIEALRREMKQLREELKR